MADEMSSSAWVLMEDDCDCGGPPPTFHLPPPPIPPGLPCELEMTCPNVLNLSDAEYKKMGSFPSVTVIVSCSLLSFVILLVIAALVWKYVRIKKKRKGVTQTKEFDHRHHGPMMNGNGVLYEDLSHARPRPPIAPPSIEMMDVTHQTLSSNGMMGNPKMDFSYFLNTAPPIYEELPDFTGNNGPSEDEFAEDELSVIDVPITQDMDPATLANIRYQEYQQNQQFNQMSRNSSKRAQSLTRKRQTNRGGTTTTGGFKSQRSLDRRSRNNLVNGGGNYINGTATNPRGYAKHEDNNMLILSNPSNGMTMKIPPHLVAVLAESCNGSGARPYEIIPTSINGGGHANPASLNGGVLVNGGGIYPSSRSSGSSYGEGSSSNSSARMNPQGNSIESSSFDSGFINSPAYDQTIVAPPYQMNPYEYAAAGQLNQQYLNSQHPSFRRLRMTAVDRDRDHPLNPLYSNHLLT